MPNKNSKKHHKPERTSVICRKKNLKENLLRFVIIHGEIVFDTKKTFQQRGYYVCDNNECLGRLKKWLKKKKQKI